MKLHVVALLLGFVCLAQAEEKSVLTDKKDRTSFALGAYTADYWKRQGLDTNDVDLDVLLQAFKGKFTGAAPLLTEKEVREELRNFSLELQARHRTRQQTLADKNKVASSTYLAENKAKPGVETTPSGLQYKVLVEGSGPSPTTNDLVVVNYRGTTLDGKEIDSSTRYGRTPTPRPVAGMKGWVEALQLMKPGAKWQVVIPPELGHGEHGSYPLIEPNSTLLYEVELVSVVPKGKNQGASSLNFQPGGQPASGGVVELIDPKQVQKGPVQK